MPVLDIRGVCNIARRAERIQPFVRTRHHVNTFNAVRSCSLQAGPSSKPPAAILAQICSKFPASAWLTFVASSWTMVRYPSINSTRPGAAAAM